MSEETGFYVDEKATQRDTPQRARARESRQNGQNPKASAPRPGRPSLLTPRAAETVCHALREGNTMRDAAAYAGVHVRTLQRWLNRDERFRRKVERARTAFKVRAMKRITEAGEAGDWRADAWLLEKLYPDEFGWRKMLRISEYDESVLQAFGLSASGAWRGLIDRLASQLEGRDSPTGDSR